MCGGLAGKTKYGKRNISNIKGNDVAQKDGWIPICQTFEHVLRKDASVSVCVIIFAVLKGNRTRNIV